MGRIPVLGIEEIVFEVEDLERSVAFYQDVIGLPLHSRGPEEAWFQAGEQFLGVFKKEREGGGEHFAFRIGEENIEQIKQHIESHGCHTETLDYSGGPSVYVRDPDGNKIELHGKRE